MAGEKPLYGEAEIKNEIKSGVHGGYFFFGDEDYLKSYYAAELVRSVTDGEDGFGDFNKITLDTDSFDGAALENALASLPLMSEKKIVEMRSPNIAAWRDSERKAFCDILSRLEQYPHSVLLVTVNKDCFDEGVVPKRPSPMYKQITKYLTPVMFPLQSESKLARWIERRAAQAGITATPEVCYNIIGYVGRDMRTLAGETDKLIAYAASHGESEIKREYIELVSCAAESDDAFELANAVIAGDRARALAALLPYKRRKDEPVAVLASVERTVCELLMAAVLVESGADKKEIASALKIHDYRAELYRNAVAGVNPDRLRAALDRCLKADLQLKTTTLGYAAIERFISTMPQLAKIRD